MPVHPHPRRLGTPSTPRHRRARRTGPAVVGVTALLLAACSSATDETGGTAPGDEPAPTTSAPAEGDGVTTSGPPAPDGGATTSAPAPAPDDGATTTAPAPAPGDDTTTSAPPEADRAELPRGGTEVFPDHLLYGYSGHPQAEALGRLGIGDIDERVTEIEAEGPEYAGDRQSVPVLELIATVVHGQPGSDGTYRTREPDSVVQEHLEAARRHDGLLLLNIQPGLSPMLEEVQHWEEFLLEPDVGVALDPEWDVAEGEVPGRVYGHTAGSELDDISAYLDDLVEEHDLPQKVMVYHQVHRGVVSDLDALQERDGVVVINSVDGIGAPEAKIETYDAIMADRPDFVHAGFKLFYEEDAALGPLMTPEQVMSLDPVPEYVLWE